jgi:methionyl-tRNA synthetase
VAKILKAEPVPKSKKLIRLQVDIGGQERQIIAGIGENFSAELLIGQTIVVVANLKPAKLMGIESQGMLLAAHHEGTMQLVTLLQDLPPGSLVK